MNEQKIITDISSIHMSELSHTIKIFVDQLLVSMDTTWDRFKDVGFFDGLFNASENMITFPREGFRWIDGLDICDNTFSTCTPKIAGFSFKHPGGGSLDITVVFGEDFKGEWFQIRYRTPLQEASNLLYSMPTIDKVVSKFHERREFNKTIPHMISGGILKIDGEYKFIIKEHQDNLLEVRQNILDVFKEISQSFKKQYGLDSEQVIKMANKLRTTNSFPHVYYKTDNADYLS